MTYVFDPPAPGGGDHLVSLTHTMRQVLEKEGSWETLEPFFDLAPSASPLITNLNVGDFGFMALRKSLNGTIEIRKVTIGPGPSPGPDICQCCGQPKK